MELNPDNRTEMIKARVSEEEKILIKARTEYYGYKQLSKYIRDDAIYEKVTVVDLIKNEILFDIIKECHLNFEKLIKYAEKTNNKKALDKLLILKK